MSLVSFDLPGSYTSFPRVSGDEPSVKSMVAKPIKFSPRERG